MTAEVILHIGMHKTGTTSIQSSLLDFDNGKIRYARLSDENHSIPVFSAFCENPYDYHIHKFRGRTNEAVDAINDQTRKLLDRETALNRDKLIISGEDIALIEPAGVQALIRYLKERAQRVRVVAYVRDPVGFASSALQEYMVWGTHTAFLPLPEYQNRFRAFCESPDVDSVDFIKFDKATLADESVVQDFCRYIDLASSEIEEIRYNDGTSLECTQLIYHFNQCGTPTQGSDYLNTCRTQFTSWLRRYMDGPGYKIPADWVWDHSDLKDIEWMQSVSGLELMPADATPDANPERNINNALDETLKEISPHTLARLQRLVADVDPVISRDENITNLLNFLFALLYFREKAA